MIVIVIMRNMYCWMNIGYANSTALGNGAIITGSNMIQLGNSAVTKVFAGTGANATLITGSLQSIGLQITGGTPAVGKVLTSDAFGVASWQNPASSSWGLTGNAGTVDGTNFIGTTDNVPFNIRVNNAPAGRINPITGTTAYGIGSGNPYISTGYYNTSIGYSSLVSNTTGRDNCSNGVQALFYNTTGNGNTGIGNG